LGEFHTFIKVGEHWSSCGQCTRTLNESVLLLETGLRLKAIPAINTQSTHTHTHNIYVESFTHDISTHS